MQYLNHSCNPNCGMLGFFDIVALHAIKNEELTTNYALLDDSNWVVPGGKCLCGSEKNAVVILYLTVNFLKMKKLSYNHMYPIGFCTNMVSLGANKFYSEF